MDFLLQQPSLRIYDILNAFVPLGSFRINKGRPQYNEEIDVG